jgi:ARP2/3 complex 16 kDa subunit (p16-Arc)
MQKDCFEAFSRSVDVFQDSQIATFVDELTDEDRAMLIKYVFAGMATGQGCGSLLKWHAAMVKHSGLGILARALVDRHF